MKITYYSATEEILAELSRRIKAERIAKSITQKELAKKTNLSQRTISNLETGRDVSFSTVIDVLRELGHLQSLELLLPENLIRPSQIISLEKNRERVRSRKNASGINRWKWGDEV